MLCIAAHVKMTAILQECLSCRRGILGACEQVLHVPVWCRGSISRADHLKPKDASCRRVAKFPLVHVLRRQASTSEVKRHLCHGLGGAASRTRAVQFLSLPFVGVDTRLHECTERGDARAWTHAKKWRGCARRKAERGRANKCEHAVTDAHVCQEGGRHAVVPAPARRVVRDDGARDVHVLGMPRRCAADAVETRLQLGEHA
mmetsp:Transcript_11051/g.27985  ORF Transcript_11051/g.27985 Transcript_11051/m.27985 type:complete len:202 (+) Transcript_11051:230-835(+)